MNKTLVAITFTLLQGMSAWFGNSAPAAYAAASNTFMQREDAFDAQNRPSSLHHFDASVATYLGPTTKKAVLQLQEEYDMSMDDASGHLSWATIKQIYRHELELLAKIIHAESRGEPYEGQVAVGAVVLNRLDSTAFPDTVKGVIEQPRAFTAVDDGQYSLKPDKKAYRAAMDAMRGIDPTNGAMYYFNPKTATSSWIWSRQQTGKIGRHLFAV
ncbi:cell wall hydrolase [Paenibacillus sp. GCM10027627]|uniref:cell wall hydrolase n=1 Tax=unclassified Paenibacillus TaxID=185978 RepID=UPI00363D6C69